MHDPLGSASASNSSVRPAVERASQMSPVPFRQRSLQNPAGLPTDGRSNLDLGQLLLPELLPSYQGNLTCYSVPALDPLVLPEQDSSFPEIPGPSAVIQESWGLNIFARQNPPQFLFEDPTSQSRTLFNPLTQGPSPFSQFQTAILSMYRQRNQSWNRRQFHGCAGAAANVIPTSASQGLTETAIIALATNLEQQRMGASYNSGVFDMRDILDDLSSLVPQSLVSWDPFDESAQQAHSVALFGSPVYHGVLFSLMNGFAGPKNMPAGALFSMVKSQTQISSLLFESLNSYRPALAMTLVDNLLRGAIEAVDEDAVKFILHSARCCSIPINLNNINCQMENDEGPYTPIQVAAHFDHLGIVKMLLGDGADVNKTHTSPYDRGALWFAVHKPKKYEPRNMELVQLLLDHNAKVTLEIVRQAIISELDDLLEAVVSQLEPAKHTYPDKLRDQGILALLDAVTYPRQRLATLAVIKLFEHSRCGKNFQPSSLGSEILEEVIYQAIMTRNIELATYLSPHAPQRGLLLVVAIKSGSNELIDIALSHGATVGGPTFSLCRVYVEKTGNIEEHIHSTPRKTHKMFHSFSYNHPKRHYCLNFPEESYRDTNGLYSCPTSALSQAIRSRDDNLTHRLLELGALSQINDKGHFEAIICAAAEAGNRHYIQTALEKGLPNFPTALQQATRLQGNCLTQALSFAILNDQAEIIEDLFHAGAEFTTAYNAILRHSIERKNEMMVDRCLEYDIVEHDPMDWIGTAALQWGNRSIIEDLMNMKIINATSSRALKCAVQTRDKGLVKLILDHDFPSMEYAANHQTENLTALGVAVTNRDEDIIRLLIAGGVVLADYSAFFAAIDTDDQGLLATLLELFSKQYPEGQVAFGGALLIHTMQEELSAFDHMLAVKFDMNQLVENFSSLRRPWRFQSSMKPGMISGLGFAILMKKGNCLELVQKLIWAGGDPNRVACRRLEGKGGCSNFCTPLMLAIKVRSTEMVELLLKNGADIHRPARRGVWRTPLQLACEVGSMKMVKLLLDKGAAVNETPAQYAGATALQLAASSGNTEVAKLLIVKGADIYAPPARERGHTALEWAAKFGRIDMLKVLWDEAQWQQPFAPAEVHHAIKLAGENGHRGCVEYLKELWQQAPSHFDLAQGGLVLDAGFQ